MIVSTIKTYEDFLKAIRHQIHQNPELGFEEHQTSQLVADKLTQWGYQVHTGLGKTGVLASLSVGEAKKTLALRADMDALPIQEQTGKVWASQRPGIMHACGHDGHTTMLLGTARYLAETRNFNGTVNLIFQPSEETMQGAPAMIKDGLFERFPCDALFGLHNMPGYPTGKLIFQEGPFMASVDEIHITIKGSGGHGALPHKAIDPILAASAIVVALQSIVSRSIDPLKSAVITVGSFQAGNVANIIPAEALIKLSIRSLDKTVREQLKERITALVTLQAQSFGAQALFHYQSGAPAVINNPKQTRFAYEVAKACFGEHQLINGAPPLMGSEDFAYMMEVIPDSAYFFLGNGLAEDGCCSIHNPGYDFNDDNLVIGSSFFALLTEKYLKK